MPGTDGGGGGTWHSPRGRPRVALPQNSSNKVTNTNKYLCIFSFIYLFIFVKSRAHSLIVITVFVAVTGQNRGLANSYISEGAVKNARTPIN